MVFRLTKYISVIVAYFEYQEGDRKSFANERLKEACNYALNMNSLEKDKDFKNQFKSLFKHADQHDK
jgi:hypothetical protein